MSTKMTMATATTLAVTSIAVTSIAVTAIAVTAIKTIAAIAIIAVAVITPTQNQAGIQHITTKRIRARIKEKRQINAVPSKLEKQLVLL